MDGEMVLMQTPFMRDLLVNRRQVQDREVNAQITDAAHKFFTSNGKLITTSLYSVNLHRWVPVPFAYTRYERTEDYARFFSYILLVLGEIYTDPTILLERFFQMVDFSAAQNAGIIEAWISHHMAIYDSKTRGLNLSDGLREEMVATCRVMAHKARAGCDVHMKRSALQISKKTDFVGETPGAGSAWYNGFIRLTQARTVEDFVEIRSQIIRDYPRTANWWAW